MTSCIDLEKIFADISHDDSEAVKRVVEDISQEILDEFSTNLAPEKWARAREKLRSYINELVHPQRTERHRGDPRSHEPRGQRLHRRGLHRARRDGRGSGAARAA